MMWGCHRADFSAHHTSPHWEPVEFPSIFLSSHPYLFSPLCCSASELKSHVHPPKPLSLTKGTSIFLITPGRASTCSKPSALHSAARPHIPDTLPMHQPEDGHSSSPSAEIFSLRLPPYTYRRARCRLKAIPYPHKSRSHILLRIPLHLPEASGLRVLRGMYVFSTASQ